VPPDLETGFLIFDHAGAGDHQQRLARTAAIVSDPGATIGVHASCVPRCDRTVDGQPKACAAAANCSNFRILLQRNGSGEPQFIKMRHPGAQPRPAVPSNESPARPDSAIGRGGGPAGRSSRKNQLVFRHSPSAAAVLFRSASGKRGAPSTRSRRRRKIFLVAQQIGTANATAVFPTRNSGPRHPHHEKVGSLTFFGRAVALPLIRSTLAGRSCRVETPLFLLLPGHLTL